MSDPSAAPSSTYRRTLLNRIISPLRNDWRVLTSMRTALVLLFFLAIAAIPGALLPQRSLNQGNVNDFIAENGFIGEIYDRLQLFDVFSSWWFTAIYALLFTSLIGCLLPRSFDLVRQLRAAPPATPRNLGRLPHSATLVTTATRQEASAAVDHQLKRWRRKVREGDGRIPGATEFSAERGYSREIGNIVFHFSLLGLLIAFAVGKFIYYEGMRVIIAEPDSPAFCNTTPAAFDSFRAGLLVDGTNLHPFCFNVKDFAADYLPTGQAAMFRSNIDYTTDLTNTDPTTWDKVQLRVNHPLRLDNVRVYLQGHGFAPRFTVTFPNGEVRTDIQQWQPDELVTFLSSGILRFDQPAGMYPRLEDRRKNQIVIQGLFAPTAQFDGNLLSSRFPSMTDPAVAIDVLRGDTGLDSGQPQSVFSFDLALIESGALEREARVNLRPGESTELPDGTTVTFDGAEEFANFQVSYDPAQNWVGIFALTMVGGLVLSLLVTRRRLWARITTAQDGRTVIELGGLAKTDRAGWGREFDIIRDRLTDAAASTPTSMNDQEHSNGTAAAAGAPGRDRNQ